MSEEQEKADALRQIARSYRRLLDAYSAMLEITGINPYGQVPFMEFKYCCDRLAEIAEID